jgi:hypothetical protein
MKSDAIYYRVFKEYNMVIYYYVLSGSGGCILIYGLFVASALHLDMQVVVYL